MKERRRRRTDPGKTAAAALGFYQNFLPTRTRYHKCSECGKENVTVRAPGEVCAVCEVKQRASARTDAIGRR